MSRADAWQSIKWRAPDGTAMNVWHLPASANDRPHLHLAHATGLNGLAYRGLLQPLQQTFQLWAWDMRGHGLSQAGSRRLSAWRTYYDDLAALLAVIDAPVYLAGHSVGGLASAAAAQRRPQQVRGLLLLEPVIFSGPLSWRLRLAQWSGQSHRMPLAKAAARRREEFASGQAVVDAYRGRSIFKSWPDDWLADYVSAGFHEVPGGLRLNCTPAFESRSFALTDTRPFRQLRGLQCPLIALLAETNSTCLPVSHRRLQRCYPSAELRVIPGSSHMLPFEHPKEFHDGMRRLLAH